MMKCLFPWNFPIPESEYNYCDRLWFTIDCDNVFEWSGLCSIHIHYSTVFFLTSAHVCNSILMALTIWNEMDCLNRSCSADLVLCTVHSVRLWAVSQRQLIDWAEKTNIELQAWADTRENTVYLFHMHDTHLPGADHILAQPLKRCSASRIKPNETFILAKKRQNILCFGVCGCAGERISFRWRQVTRKVPKID